MTDKVYIVTDLGPGDGGKGGVVQKICDMVKPRFVVKVGGGEGCHGMQTSRGESFVFSHWGCGTFGGVKTFISEQFVCIPEGILNEGDALRFSCGVHNAFEMLFVDPRALCVSHYHRIASRLKELARGSNPRGTTGTGVGTAYRESLAYPQLAIRAGDLTSHDLKDRIAAIRNHVRKDLHAVIEAEVLPSDREESKKLISLLGDDDYLSFSTERFKECARRVKITSSDFLGQEILGKESPVVVESSQGVLLDYYFGFFPHVTSLRTLPCFRHKMLKDAGFGGRIVNLGVVRAYAIRYGPGPMPTDSPVMYESLFPGSTKPWNRYQGNPRVGPLDFVMLKYALEVCGGPLSFDALAVTWFDQIQSNGLWSVCKRYNSGTEDKRFFGPDGAIKVCRFADGSKQQKYQERLTKQLQDCEPEVITYPVFRTASRDKMFQLCDGVISDELGVPVRMVGFGPTELDKVCK